MEHRLWGRKGVILIEVLVSGAILALCLFSLMSLFMHCGMLADTSRDISSVLSQVQSQMESIKNTDFDNIMANYGTPPNNVFDIAQPEGKGVIYLSQPFGPDLVQIRINASWKSRRDLSIIGEDNIILNGVIDGGEDINGNGELDSVVSITSFIARRL